MKRLIWVSIAVLLVLTSAGPAFSFSFSESEADEAAEEQAQQAETRKKIDNLLAVPCQDRLKKKKIAVILGQDDARADSDVLFMEVNDKLQGLGLKTFSQKEITDQIARAEMDAFLNNDMDAAASAASRLKADFMLRGIIRSKTRTNPVVGVDEVYISMVFTLIDSSGKIISNVSAQGESYSGKNTLAAALALVREKSGLMVAKLYNDYCRKAGAGAPSGMQAETQPKVDSVEDF